MNFSEIPFLFVFLPLFIIGYTFVKPSFRSALILLAGVLFVAAGRTAALFWLTGLTLAGYGLGLWIQARRTGGKIASPVLWGGIGLFAGILLAVKWTVTYPTCLFAFGGFRPGAFMLPLGISYFTFQIIAYLTDVSIGIIPAERNFLRLLNTVLFFPKVASGPIVKYQQLSGQLVCPDPSVKDAVTGGIRILTGEIKCVIIADQLGRFANPVFSRPRADLDPSFAWLALIASALQIYFDFSGYSDIAIGLGRTIGIRLPENFNYPFVSQSISELWRRWHMTLIGWFREYVFYPLERRRFRFGGQQINLLAVFLLTGLWHGPTLNYLTWGVLQGLAMVFESLSPGRRFLRAAWRPVRHLYFILVFLFSWVFFRSGNMTFAFEFLGRLAGSRTGLVVPDQTLRLPGPSAGWPLITVVLFGVIFSLPVLAAIEARLKNAPGSRRLQSSFRRSSIGAGLSIAAGFVWERKRWWLIPMAVVFAVFGIVFSLTMTSAASPFIYTQF
jgi:alginate O-acetyltransferase complex protein AlgI